MSRSHESKSNSLGAKSLEDSEGGITEGDLDDSEIFDKKWNIDKDPWQSLLVPPEPDPHLYHDFESSFLLIL